MNNKTATNVVKIVVILAVVFCVVGLLFPWMQMSYDKLFSSAGLTMPSGIKMGGDFYTWSGHVYIDLGSYASQFGSSGLSNFDMWSIFYLFNTGVPSSMADTMYVSTNVNAENVVPIALMFLAFILCVLTIIIGLITFRKIGKKRITGILLCGILSLIAIIFFAVAMHFTISQATDAAAASANAVQQGSGAMAASMVSSMFGYSVGFILTIISVILFFVAFGLSFLISTTSSTIMPPQMYPSYEPQQTQAYENLPRSSESTPTELSKKKVCPMCGATIDGNPEFCINCGERLK